MSTDPSSSNPAAPNTEPRTLGLAELGLTIGLVWTFELFVGLVVVAVYGQQAEMDPLGILATSLVAGSWTLIAVAGVLYWRLGAVLAPLRLRIKPGNGAMMLALVGGFLGAIMATVLHETFSTGDSMMARLSSTNSGLLAVSVIAIALPVVEEVYYRGLVFGALRSRLPGAGAIAIVSLWFAAVHASQVAGDWIALPIIAAMGLFWTVLRERTGSLWPGLVSHLLYNGTLIVSAWVTRLLETG